MAIGIFFFKKILQQDQIENHELMIALVYWMSDFLFVVDVVLDMIST